MVNFDAKGSDIVESRDTGERRSAFGFEARHIVRTTKLNRNEASLGERTTDGWYIDLPFAIECSGTGKDSELGFAIEETITDRFPRQSKEERIIDRVVDISETRLDPALFRFPMATTAGTVGEKR